MLTLVMSIDVLSIKDFNDKVKSYIPFHEVSSPPRIGDVEGQTFECGCGEIHSMNFDLHYFIADGGMFKAVFLSPACGYLNALKLKKMFSFFFFLRERSNWLRSVSSSLRSLSSLSLSDIEFNKSKDVLLI